MEELVSAKQFDNSKIREKNNMSRISEFENWGAPNNSIIRKFVRKNKNPELAN